MKYYLGPYVRNHNVSWVRRSPPAGALWAFDFSTPAECKSTAEQSGMGLFVVPDATTLASPYTLIVQGDWNSAPVEARRNTFRTLVDRGGFGRPISVDGSTIQDWFLDVLINKADPLGYDTCRPLIPTSNLQYTVPLVGKATFTQAVDINGASSAALRTAIQNEYIQMKAASLAGQVIGPDGQPDPQAYRRWLQAQGERYRINNPQDVFIPAGEPKVDPLPHNTTYSDDFNRSDSAGFGASYTFVDGSSAAAGVASNQAAVTGSNAFDGCSVRYESDVSSSDVFTQATVITKTDFCVIGLNVRMSSSAYDCYCWQSLTGFGVDHISWNKWVGGVETEDIATPVTAPTASQIIRGEANGSTLTGKVAGSTVSTTTDTAITTGLRGGFRLLRNDGGGNVGASVIDLFSFGDLAAASSVKTLLLTGVG